MLLSFPSPLSPGSLFVSFISITLLLTCFLQIRASFKFYRKIAGIAASGHCARHNYAASNTAVAYASHRHTFLNPVSSVFLAFQAYPLWDRTQVARENLTYGYSYITPNASMLGLPDFPLYAPPKPVPFSSCLFQQYRTKTNH
jgi:hypothetical protein